MLSENVTKSYRKCNSIILFIFLLCSEFFDIETVISEINHKATNYTDVEAVKNIATFELVFNRYVSRLYKAATRYMNTDDAKDLVQDLMMETWNKRDRLRGNTQGSLQNYLFIRLKFKILDFYSKKTEQTLWEEALPELIKLAKTHVHEEAIVKELNKIIRDTMLEMSPSELVVFRLRWEKQLSVKETANMLNISTKSVMNRLNLAMKTVRNNVKNYYNEDLATEYRTIVLAIMVSLIS